MNTFLNAGKKVVFDDGAHIVYVNNKIKDDTPLGRLMHDFDCKNPDKMFYEIIADKVSEHKVFERSGYKVAGVIEKFILKLARIRPPLT